MSSDAIDLPEQPTTGADRGGVESPSRDPRGPAEGAALVCKQCGGTMEVRVVGALHDKRAVCPYCQAEIDLPDSFQRGEQRRDHEQHAWGSRTVESVSVETRSDGPSEHLPQPVTPEVENVLRILREKGYDVPDGAFMKQMQQQGAVVSTEHRVTVATQGSAENAGCLFGLLRLLGLKPEKSFGQATRTPAPMLYSRSVAQLDRSGFQELSELLGEVVPPKDPRNCPGCNAVIPGSAAQCEWCGTALS